MNISVHKDYNKCVFASNIIGYAYYVPGYHDITCSIMNHVATAYLYVDTLPPLRTHKDIEAVMPCDDGEADLRLVGARFPSASPRD